MTTETTTEAQSHNDAVVIAHYSGRFPDTRPRENVRTFAAWISAGRVVRKGEKGCKLSVVIEKKNEAGAVINKFIRSVAVFHEGQTRDRDEPDTPGEPDEAPDPTPRAPATHWAKLREKEQRERSKANAEIARPRQTNTRKRMGQARDAIEAHTRTLTTCAIAAHACNHQARAELLGVTTWALCDAYRVALAYRPDTVSDELRAFCAEATTGNVDTRASEILKATDESMGSGLDHFPTKTELAARMVRLAELNALSDALEPSCGRGNILLEIAKTGAATVGVERSYMLHKVAALRAADMPNVTTFDADFMTFEPAYHFDAVVMNPPFSADIEHISKAWSLLSPGGRLVAIAGESCWSSSRKKGAEAFREWLADVGAVTERLDGAESFEGTTASARLIVAYKPAEYAI